MPHLFKQVITSSIIFVAIAFICGCAENTAQQYESTPQNLPVFTAVGYAPIKSQKGDTFDIKMINAIKASKLEAYKELAEQVHGVLLTSQNAASDSQLKSDSIDIQVNGLVRGAKVLKSYHDGDLYITELQLDMRTLGYLDKPHAKQEKVQVIDVEEQVYY